MHKNVYLPMFITMLTLLVNISFSQCLSGNCKNGLGTFQYNNGVYGGKFKDGLRHGYGDFVCEEKHYSYRGFWKEGKKHSLENDYNYGVIQYSNGDQLNAVWRNDSIVHTVFVNYYEEGKAILRREKVPIAIYTYNNGDIFSGVCLKDNWDTPLPTKSGKGLMYYKNDGSFYRGNWKENKYEGEGCFIEGYRHITLTVFSKSISVPFSGYLNSFCGNWSNGVKNGSGKFSTDYFNESGIERSGDIIEADWKNDTMLNLVKVLHDNKDRYEGEYANGKRNGQGIYYYYTSGDNYEGEWKNDLKHGMGVYTTRDGKVSSGYWENDVFVGVKKEIPIEVFENINEDYRKDISDNASSEVKMKKIGGVYEVPCKINGLQLNFIFDTGASSVAISATEARFMLKNGYLSFDDFIGIQYYQLANGEIVEGARVILNKVEIGDKILHNVEASVSYSLDAPLLLGQSVLSRFGKVKIDYTNNTLSLE